MNSAAIRHPKPDSNWLKSIKQSQLITQEMETGEMQVYTKLKASDCMLQLYFVKIHIPPKRYFLRYEIKTVNSEKYDA